MTNLLIYFKDRRWGDRLLQHVCFYEKRIKEAKGNDKNQEQLKLEEHLRVANSEFEYCKTSKMDSVNDPSVCTIYIVMDFAENVLLPSILRNPGGIHFTKGLKFNFVGVSSSNLGHSYVFGLPEGH